jgi:hypothetical protein
MLNHYSWLVLIAYPVINSNQNPYIDEEQTTQWQKEKVQKNKHNDLQNMHINLKIE